MRNLDGAFSTIGARSLSLAVVTLAMVGAGACASVRDTVMDEPRHPEPITVRLQASDGTDHGAVRLEDTPNGLLVQLDLQELPEGTHAFHFHTTGDCEGDFTSAGGHFNPDEKQHGLRNEEGMHAGDLPNIHADSNGSVRVEFFAPELRLAGGSNPLLDDDGTAIIIHAGADDYSSDPTGGAGARIACGVLRGG